MPANRKPAPMGGTGGNSDQSRQASEFNPGTSSPVLASALRKICGRCSVPPAIIALHLQAAGLGTEVSA